MYQLNAEDRRIQLPSIKPSIKEICNSVPAWFPITTNSECWHNLTYSTCPTTSLPTPYTYLFLYSGQHLQSPRNSHTHHCLYTLVPIVLFPKITFLLPKRYSSFKTQLMVSLLLGHTRCSKHYWYPFTLCHTSWHKDWNFISCTNSSHLLMFSWKLVLRKILSLRGEMNAMVDEK